MPPKLSDIVNMRENSSLPLSTHQEKILGALKMRYQPIIEERGGLEGSFNVVKEDIIRRYRNHPAEFRLKSGKILHLKLTMDEFKAQTSNFTKTQKKEALKAYYQHPTHTVYRYLSKPNPWMSHEAEHVQRGEKNTRWANFSDHRETITLMWLAANDAMMPPTDDFTLETRIEEFIREMALIARAHNWDKTREIKGPDGQVVLHASGEKQHEYYDDLEGDKPACLRGVMQRLMQALKGHPLNVPDLQMILPQLFREYLREHMRVKFNQASTSLLEAVLIDYLKVVQGELALDDMRQKKSIFAWNVSRSDIRDWKKKLSIQYRDKFSQKEISTVFEIAGRDFFPPDLSTPHFISHVLRCDLHSLCLQSLNQRADTLARKIEQHPAETLLSFLNGYDEMNGDYRIFNAIHLELLGKIGQKLGPSAFVELLCKDEATQTRCVTVLMAYAGHIRLNEWLSILPINHRDAILFQISQAISEEASGVVASANNGRHHSSTFFQTPLVTGSRSNDTKTDVSSLLLN